MSIRGSLVGDGESEVSIVIPHYNNSSFLLDAVRSAIASVSDPAQVIVVDDGSTDPRAPEVLEKVLRLGPRVIRQDNSGVSAARNAGIAVASTPYILALDSDDMLAPGAARAVADAFKRDPDAAIVVGANRDMMSDGSVGELNPLLYGVTRADMLFETRVPIASGFRRSDWERVGGFPEGIPLGEDWIFWMRILRSGGAIVEIPDEVYWIRKHEGQVTRRIRDARQVAAAQNLVLRENIDLVTLHAEEVVSQLTEARELLAQYRYSYRHADLAKARARSLFKSIRGVRRRP